MEGSKHKVVECQIFEKAANLWPKYEGGGLSLLKMLKVLFYEWTFFNRLKLFEASSERKRLWTGKVPAKKKKK